ncbi:hypothetical protein PVK06_044493 [Gossypium arboreum]|uniref:Uncharacterized protein n=1 Tax=Gossypium arboreum TaxID=29729 RepID=A0ABR0MRC3_GOSAR|nr:hypothetical protein PVK06_044493 [Gossypium arboreum]
MRTKERRRISNSILARKSSLTSTMGIYSRVLILRKEEEGKVSDPGSCSGSALGWSRNKGEEIVSKREEGRAVKTTSKDADKGRKLPAQAKNNNQGKRKEKKYRSHRKHLLAREAATAASWTQKSQICGAATTAAGGGKRDMNPWLAPTMGFPPMPPSSPLHHHFRSLHVWGHPTVDQSLIHLWPKHLAPPPPPPRPTWEPPRAGPSYWHHHHKRVTNGISPGIPCFPQPLPLATRRFAAAPVPGIQPHHGTMYKADPGIHVLSSPHPLMDFHPSKESINAAIGDVLSKPWQPLPQGLKPPASDTVLGELQRPGLPNIPPSSA